MSGLTEFEKKELKEGFKLLNKDGDDELSFEDLKQQLKALKFPYDDQQIQDLILVATGSAKGKVRFDEFISLFSHKDQNQLEKEANTAFEIITERDKISKQDLKKFFTSIGIETTDEEINELMEQNGTNGKLSQEELMKMLNL